MNCFTHALPYLDRPHFMVGCCVPDWLSAVDRKCRVRERSAKEFIGDPDPLLAAVAQGVVQHHEDDHWFHQTEAFATLNMQFSVEIRDVLNGESGFRAGLLGHIIVELLLDAFLIEQFPGQLEVHYDRVAQVSPHRLQEKINRFATRPTQNLVYYIERYLDIRFLFDYLDDSRLLFRLNNVMKRVKLESLDDRILTWIPSARHRVYQRAADLLCDYPLKFD